MTWTTKGKVKEIKEQEREKKRRKTLAWIMVKTKGKWETGRKEKSQEDNEISEENLKRKRDEKSGKKSCRKDDN